MRVYPNHGRVHVTVARSRTFRSVNSEALRLPKDVVFGDDVELVLVRSGNVMTNYPAATSIADMLARLHTTPAPREIERRDDEPLADRVGP